jgi:hypothetical protein
MLGLWIKSQGKLRQRLRKSLQIEEGLNWKWNQLRRQWLTTGELMDKGL